jgi:hypothetical protein
MKTLDWVDAFEGVCPFAASQRGYTPTKHSLGVKWAIPWEAVPNSGVATSGVAL